MGGGGNSPQAPQLSQDFLTDPNDPRVRGFDTSPQKASLMRDFARQGGQARAQTLASASQALGGSRSSAAPGMLADIGAQQAYGQQKALGDLAQGEYNGRVSLMDMLNNVEQSKNALKVGQYNAQTGAQDAAARRQQGNIGLGIQGLGGLASLLAL